MLQSSSQFSQLPVFSWKSVNLILVLLVNASFKCHYSICFIVLDKKAGKFKEWLDVSSLIEVKPSGAVMEILSYMAYETVGQVTNLCPFSYPFYLWASRKKTID